MTVALVLASVALAVALTAVALALVLMRQNATTTTQLRKHRHAHERTHGRPDPDPEHHGTSPTVQRLADELEQATGYLAALGEWAEGAERRLPPRPAAVLTTDEVLTPERAAALRAHPEQLRPTAEDQPPTAAMPATHRPKARP